MQKVMFMKDNILVWAVMLQETFMKHNILVLAVMLYTGNITGVTVNESAQVLVIFHVFSVSSAWISQPSLLHNAW